MGICCSKQDYVSNNYAQSDAQGASPRSPVNATAIASSNQLDGHLGELAALNRGASRVSSLRGPRIPLSREQMAVTKVLHRVRDEFYLRSSNFKSSNKTRSGRGDVETHRVENAQKEILRMRGQALYDSDTDFISVAMEGRAHNCGELASLAKLYLEDEGFVARTIDFKADHSAAVIGADFGGLPADMTQWEPSIYICDPWTNIACRGSDYPDQFLAKMAKWQGQGKSIKIDNRGFVSPLDQQWVNDMLQGGKAAC